LQSSSSHYTYVYYLIKVVVLFQGVPM
jgi:hypothetical protein